LDLGYAPVPIDGKAACVEGWATGPYTERRIEAYCQRFGDKNVGILTGRDGIVVIDIDESDAALADVMQAIAFRVIGETPFIRVGQWPKRALLYRMDEAVRFLDFGNGQVLGNGRQVAVAGIHPTTQKAYYWPEETLLDTPIEALPQASTADIEICVTYFRRLYGSAPAAMKKIVPELRIGSGDRLHGLSPEDVQIGKRNNYLFLNAKEIAGRVQSPEELAHAAREINDSFPEPLDEAEVELLIEHVWTMKRRRSLFLKGRQYIEMSKDEAIRLARDPRALTLLVVLRATRSTDQFTIPQASTAEAIGWGENSLRKAIDVLVRQGHLQRAGTRPCGAGRRSAIVYSWARRRSPGAGGGCPVSSTSKMKAGTSRSVTTRRKSAPTRGRPLHAARRPTEPPRKIAGSANMSRRGEM
jgi:hypothetical protein